MKLNFWQRLGVVASVLWLLGAGLYSLEKTADEAQALAQSASNLCLEISDPKVDCSKEFLEALHAYDSSYWPNAAVAAVLPIPFAWLLAYVVLWTSRWVLAGRHRERG